MVIGARILSDNLSGKTASVTFTSLTGTPESLGSKTIPFNNINSYPYGTYNLYFSEYDYTYSLFVPDETPLEITLGAEYEPGSVVAKYSATSSRPASYPINLTFGNTLKTFSGPDVEIFTGVTINSGQTTGQTIVTVSTDYGNLTGEILFTQLSGVPIGSTGVVTAKPIGQQGLTFISTTAGSTNWKALTYVVGGLSTEILDFGVDTTTYNQYTIYPITEKGYGFYFEGVSNNQDKLFVVTNSAGVEVFRASATTDNWDIDVPDGKIATMNDKQNNILYYSDGVSGYTFDYNSEISGITGNTNTFIQWDWDAINKNNTFVFTIRGFDSNIQKNFRINGSSVTLIETLDTSELYVEYSTYMSGSYFVKSTYNTVDSKFDLIEILDDDMNVLHSEDFSGLNMDGLERTFSSKERFIGLFYDNDTPTNDSKLVFYDGITNTFSVTTIDRTNYPDVTIQTDSSPFPDTSGIDAAFISFYKYDGFNDYGVITSYCKFLYMLKDETTWTEYVFQDSGVPDKSIEVWGDAGDYYITRCDIGDDNASVLTISKGGVEITTIAPKSESFGLNFYNIGEKMILQRWTNDSYTGVTYYLFNNSGQTTDSVTYTLDSPYQTSTWVAYGLFYLSNSGTNDAAYVNETTDEFVSTSYYDDREDPSDYFDPEFREPSPFIMWNPSTRLMRVYGRTSVSNEFELPENNGNYHIRVGKNNFMYIYGNTESDTWDINFYDFDFNLITEYSTNQSTNYNLDSWGIKDRYTVRIDDGTNFNFYFPKTDGTVVTGQLTNEDSSYSINDYIWWD